MEDLEPVDGLQGSTLDLEPSVGKNLTAGATDAQAEGRIVVTQQVADDECATETWPLAQGPGIGDAVGPAQLPACLWRQVSGRYRFGVWTGWREVHAQSEQATETGERDPPDQHFYEGDGSDDVQTGQDLAWPATHDLCQSTDHATDVAP